MRLLPNVLLARKALSLTNSISGTSHIFSIILPDQSASHYLDRHHVDNRSTLEVKAHSAPSHQDPETSKYRPSGPRFPIPGDLHTLTDIQQEKYPARLSMKSLLATRPFQEAAFADLLGMSLKGTAVGPMAKYS